MTINSDINILGGLPDFNLVLHYLEKDSLSHDIRHHHTFTAIKTNKSVVRFEKAISETFIKFPNDDITALFTTALVDESISKDNLLILFWNASYNNQLLRYLNEQVYFVNFYSGRISIKQDDVAACLLDLREREEELKKWSESTIQITASKYLTLLKKLNLMEGTLNKTIIHPYLNDKLFILFVYWLTSIETKANFLESEWLKYSFCEKSLFIERLMQKKFVKFFQLNYTGDKLKIETTIPYSIIYHAIK